MRIAILDDYQGVALSLADWSALARDADVQVFRDHLVYEDEVCARLRDFEVVVAMRERTPFLRTLLERLPRLRLLVTTGMQNASIDLGAASDHGVVVSGTGSAGTSTAELTWGLILALTRGIPREDASVRAGQWQVGLGTGLEGKTLGILGLGRIGAQVARYGTAFGMRVVAWSQHLTDERAAECGAVRLDKKTLFSDADIISVHLVLGERSRGLVGASEFGQMKTSAYFVNTSRGPIIDESALIDALECGAIAGAALDVFDEEPLPVDHPLRRLSNTIVTPHIGYVSVEMYRLFFEDAVENIQSFIAGSPVRVLNPRPAAVNTNTQSASRSVGGEDVDGARSRII